MPIATEQIQEIVVVFLIDIHFMKCIIQTFPCIVDPVYPTFI